MITHPDVRTSQELDAADHLASAMNRIAEQMRATATRLEFEAKRVREGSFYTTSSYSEIAADALVEASMPTGAGCLRTMLLRAAQADEIRIKNS